jgi:hypothetical protein
MAVVFSGLFAAGCVGGSKGLSSEDKEKLKAYILDAPPADIPHKIDVNFENKIHLIGYKFDPETARAGQEVKLTYYWRCDDTLDEGWKLFTHTKDEGNGQMGNLDFTGPLRDQRNGSHQVLGPEHWEKGKVYVDEQTYKVPDDVKGAEVTVYTGIWKEDARLRIISGPNDGDNSAIVGKIKTGVQPKAEEHTANDVPTLSAVKLAKNDAIKIDGKGDEPEWGGAASTGPFVDVGTGKPNSTFPVNGSAKLTWDDNNLYVLVTLQEADFYTGFTDAKGQPTDFTATGQPKLWTKDTFEMMLEPDAVGTNTNYYELQINPQNKIFKSQFDALQQPAGDRDKGPFGHEDWDPKLKSAVSIQKGPDGKATGYTVEAAIPWAGYSKAANHPPKPGEAWRLNFYGIKQNGAVAWSPILGQGNFHKASRFGKVTWTVQGAPPAGSAPAVASGSAAPAPSGATSTAGGPPRFMPIPRGPGRLQQPVRPSQ